MSKVVIVDDIELIEKYWNPKPGDICIDVGFGPGPWTLRALELGAFVYAFDPSPHAHKALLEELRKHNFSKVAIAPVALWDTCGVQTFRRENQVVPDEPTEADSLVTTTTLDSYLNATFTHWMTRPQVTHMNLDCEGAELRVLRGAESVLFTDKPLLIIEVHQGVRKDEITSYLDSLANTEHYVYEEVNNFLIAKAVKS